jgi:hypothetical protein
MVSDKRLFLLLFLLILIPLTLAVFGGDRFRYPCQDPKNWDKQMCKLPDCDVTRTCPEHIFKGQRDPRLGPPQDSAPAAPAASCQQCPAPQPGARSGK